MGDWSERTAQDQMRNRAFFCVIGLISITIAGRCGIYLSDGSAHTLLGERQRMSHLVVKSTVPYSLDK